MPRESWRVKLLFVVVFLGVAAATFIVAAPLAEWVKSSTADWVSTFAVQAVAALPFMLIIFAIERKLIWKLVQQDIFSTIHPICLGAYVGYVVHFALR